jgi:hypothetical protein
MAFLLSRGSAIEWLRKTQDVGARYRRYVIPYSSLEASKTRLSRHLDALEGLSRPIQLVTWNREDRRRTNMTSCSTMTLPSGKYPCYLVERGVFCAAPELVFLQMASRLDYDALLFLGCELCGRYGVWENKTVWRGPICDIDQIKDFLAECSGVHGRKKAARALEGVLPGAASPMEIGLALCFVLPKAAGGFGLPAPELNHALPVRGAAARLWDWPTITPDLLWDNHKIAIEYDSDDEHTASEKITNDSIRRNVLEEMGYRVVSVTNGIFSDPVQLERAASVVANVLGTGSIEAVDEAWIQRCTLQKHLRDLAMHPEKLLG